MEEDILNYLPTVMFRGTPCMSPNKLAFLMLTYALYQNNRRYEVSKYYQ